LPIPGACEPCPGKRIATGSVSECDGFEVNPSVAGSLTSSALRCVAGPRPGARDTRSVTAETLAAVKQFARFCQLGKKVLSKSRGGPTLLGNESAGVRVEVDRRRRCIERLDALRDQACDQPREDVAG